jgi:hypothetical protein
LCAGVVAIFEVREVDIDDAVEEVHGVCGAVHVGVPDLWYVSVEML